MAEQYDANRDFAVFANKDQTVGGHMDLKEKQNIAENIIDQKVNTPSISVEEPQKVKDFLQDIQQTEVSEKQEKSLFPEIKPQKVQNVNNMPEDIEIVESLNELNNI